MYQYVQVVCYRSNTIMCIVALRQGRFKAALDPTAQRTAKKGSCFSGFVPNVFLNCKLRIATISFVMSVRPYGIDRSPLGGFS